MGNQAARFIFGIVALVVAIPTLISFFTDDGHRFWGQHLGLLFFLVLVVLPAMSFVGKRIMSEMAVEANRPATELSRLRYAFYCALEELTRNPSKANIDAATAVGMELELALEETGEDFSSSLDPKVHQLFPGLFPRTSADAVHLIVRLVAERDHKPPTPS